MRCSRSGPRSILLPAALLMAMMAVWSVGPGALPAQAQDEEVEPHPAHIHDGSCVTLGGIAFPLNDVAYSSMAMGGTPTADMAMGETVGSSSAVPLETSVTVVDVPLEQITDGQHAINVHLSAEEIGTYIACGNIGGVVHERENGEGMEVVIGLAELNDSGHVGIAWLGDDGEGGTNVSVSLIEPEEMQ